MEISPMAEGSFSAFLKVSNDQAARERARSDFMSLEEARTFTQKQVHGLLKDGIKTGGHHFFDFFAMENRVGQAWMKVDEKDKLAWIYFIVIHDAFQRKGYGKKAMQLLKEEAKGLGASALWLNVSAENRAAQALYQSSGLKAQAIHMNCALD